MNLSIKQVRAFLTLVEEENFNFTRASEKMHMSQPAFSNLISNLEQELGYRLFDRDTRKVQLNEEGIHFIKLARNLLYTYDDTIREIESRGTKKEIKVSLAVMPSIVVHWVPRLITNFQNAHHNIKIELIDAQWDHCLQALLKGNAELALTATNPVLTDISSELLFTDKFFLVCHKSHPLAQKDKIELSDLLLYDVIGFAKGTSLRLYTDRLIDILSIKYVLEVRQLTTMLGLVAANYGVGIVTELTLFQFQHDNIVIKEFSGISLERSIYLIKHKTRKMSHAAHLLYNHIKADVLEGNH